ncbi:hypothetical protein, partial [Streptomyces sp. NPDC057838]|uniref:hypothetical protein n=1 Tax=Streptomyces sp. NPDC057838 TaxID=3346261 RepID=UPI0036B04EDF
MQFGVSGRGHSGQKRLDSIPALGSVDDQPAGGGGEETGRRFTDAARGTGQDDSVAVHGTSPQESFKNRSGGGTDGMGLRRPAVRHTS